MAVKEIGPRDSGAAATVAGRAAACRTIWQAVHKTPPSTAGGWDVLLACNAALAEAEAATCS